MERPCYVGHVCNAIKTPSFGRAPLYDCGMTQRLILSIVAVVYFLPQTLLASDFAIRDGDTVVFLGDSITAERTYGKIIENYTLLRFPTRKAHFINAGHGGETMAGSLARLDRDVFDRGATL